MHAVAHHSTVEEDTTAHIYGCASLEEVASRVIDYLLEFDDRAVRDTPGKLLGRMARDTESNYTTLTEAVRYLEALGFVSVARIGPRHPERANRVERVALIL